MAIYGLVNPIGYFYPGLQAVPVFRPLTHPSREFFSLRFSRTKLMYAIALSTLIFCLYPPGANEVETNQA